MAGFFTRGIRSHQEVGKLKKVAVNGGGVMTICDAPGGTGGSWGEDGSIIAPLRWKGGLSRVSAAHGNPEPLTTLKSDELATAGLRYYLVGRPFSLLPGQDTVSMKPESVLTHSQPGGPGCYRKELSTDGMCRADISCLYVTVSCTQRR